MKELGKKIIFLLVLFILWGSNNGLVGAEGITLFEYNGHYYKIITRIMNFEAAQNYCEELGGHLAVIDSQAENDALTEYGKECNYDCFMIGLYDENGSNGTWDTWVTGERVIYSNWGEQQPDWTGQKVCILNMTANANYGWEIGEWDNGYDGDYHFLCEWESKVNINKADIKLDKDSYEYTGEKIEPSFTVKMGSVYLEKNIDYTVTYLNNQQVGEMQIVITGKGIYTGTVSKKFYIIPGKVKNLRGNNAVSTETAAYGGVKRNIEVTWNEMKDVDGYIIQYSQDSSFKTKSEEIIDWGDLEYISNTQERGSTWYVRVCAFINVNGKKYQGDWSDTLKVQIGNQILANEMWGFTNFVIEHTAYSLYEMVYQDSAKARVHFVADGGSFNGNDTIIDYPEQYGVCWGMVMLGAAAHEYNIPMIESFNQGDSLKNIDEIERDLVKSSQTNMSLRDMITYVHIMQDCPEIVEEEDNNYNNLHGFYEAVKQCQKGKGNCVQVKLFNNMVDSNEDDNKCHEIMAVGILDETGDEIKIEVYDPNDGTSAGYMTLIKGEEGDLKGWSLGESDYPGHVDNGGTALEYTVQNSAYVARRLNNVDQEIGELRNRGLITMQGEDIDFFGFVEDNSELTVIEPLANSTRSIIGNKSSISCWTGNRKINLSDVPANVEVSFAFSNQYIKISVDTVADIVLEIKEDKENVIHVNTSENAKFKAEFYDDSGTELERTLLEGITNSGKDMVIEKNQAIQLDIQGVSSISYDRIQGKKNEEGLMEQPNKISFAEKLDGYKYYQIVDNETIIQLKESSQKNGVYDKILKVIDKCNHSFSSWITKKEATALEEGEQQCICTICGKIKKEAIKKLEPSIKLTTNSLKIQVKKSTTKLKVTEMTKGDYLKSVKSNKPKVLKVTNVKKNGTFKLTAKKIGKVTLTIKLASGLTKKVSVRIQKAAVKTKKISEVPKKLTLKKGKTYKLKPVVTPITSLQKLTYSSYDKKIAVVSKKGVITAKKVGTVKIIVKSGNKKVVCTVKVKK